MIVIILFLCLGTLSFFIPKSLEKKYFLASCFVASTMLACYTPPETDDLFRYYQLFDIAKNLTAKDFWSYNFHTSDWLLNYLLTDYLNNSKMFAAILFLLSRIGIKQLLPFVFSILTYIPVILLLFQACEDQNASKRDMCICFFVALACIDLRFITALRNMAAYAWFCYILYLDLVKKRNTILCFVGYLLLCELHMSCIALLFIRAIVLIFNKHMRVLIVVALVSLFSLSKQISYVLATFFNWIPYMERLSQRIIDYNIKRTSYNTHGAIFFIGSLLACLGIYVLQKRKGNHVSKTLLYDLCFEYVFAYTIGSVRQYDVLTRSCPLIAIMCFPYIISLLKKNNLSKAGIIIYISNSGKASISSELISLCRLVGVIVFSFIFYTLCSYTPMQKGFDFFVFR